MDIFQQLLRDEGLRLHPYVDTVGKTTIGVGRNLIDKGITSDEANILLKNDVEEAETTLRNRLPWFESLDPIRQAVLVNMTFNMGFEGLSEFTKMLSAAAQGNWAEAAKEMSDSVWAREVGERAERLSAQMANGVWT
jgi:lysozyme